MKSRKVLPIMPEPDSHYFTTNKGPPKKIFKHFEVIRGNALSFQSGDGVFSPETMDKGTKILIENLYLPPIDITYNLLDVGAGYGPICLWLSQELSRLQYSEPNAKNGMIFASEINERAQWLLNRNIQTSKISNISLLKGDLIDFRDQLKSEKITFNGIYSNPPFRLGHEKLLALFRTMMDLLNPEGIIQYVHLKKLGANPFLEKVIELEPDWYYEITKKKAGYFIILISRKEPKWIPKSPPTAGYF